MYPNPARHLPIALIALAAIGLATAFSASAQSAQIPQRLGLCAACHGGAGIALEKTAPNLVGQNLEYLRSAAQQYPTGARKYPAMRAALGMLGTAQMDQVLQWYATHRPPAAVAPS